MGNRGAAAHRGSGSSASLSLGRLLGHPRCKELFPVHITDQNTQGVLRRRGLAGSLACPSFLILHCKEVFFCF